jgi:hypothetical protein
MYSLAPPRLDTSQVTYTCNPLRALGNSKPVPPVQAPLEFEGGMEESAQKYPHAHKKYGQGVKRVWENGKNNYET